MPYIKNKVEELTLKEEEHSTSQTIMTMTRTRRKQKQEMVKRAVREAEERQSELRQQYPLRSTAVVQLSAYEPALFYQQHVILQQQQQQSAQPTPGGGTQAIAAAQSQVVQSQAQQQGQQSLQGNAALNATTQQQFQENMATLGTGEIELHNLIINKKKCSRLRWWQRSAGLPTTIRQSAKGATNSELVRDVGSTSGSTAAFAILYS